MCMHVCVCMSEIRVKMFSQFSWVLMNYDYSAHKEWGLLLPEF
jgi:hypothetical protein